MFIVDLSSSENGSDLFDQNSVAGTEQFFHRRRQNRIAVQGATANHIENLTTTITTRLKIVDQ